MALFDNYTPEEEIFRRRLNYDGTFLGKLALASAGYKTDGSGQNFIGKAANVAGPVFSAIAGGIAGGLAGNPVAGAKAGFQLYSGVQDLQNNVLESVLYGTQQKDNISAVENSQDSINGIISAVLGAAGNFSGVGSFANIGTDALSDEQKNQFGQKSANVIPDSVFGESASSLGSLSNIKSVIPMLFKDGGQVNPIDEAIGSISITDRSGYDEVSNAFLGNVSFSGVDLSSVAIPEAIISTSSNTFGHTRDYTDRVTDDIYTLIAQAENPKDSNLNSPHVYSRSNNIGSGHFGKYQFSGDFVKKYYGGTPESFLKDHQGQEKAMRARMNDLKGEVNSFFKKTGANIGYNDAALLIHFRGLGDAISKYKNGQFDKRTTNNPSINEYFDRAYGKLLNRYGGEVSAASYTDSGSVTKEFVIDGVPYNATIKNPGHTLYGSEDPTEDIFLLSKRSAENYGLTELIEHIGIGEMRYGERVFDQDANIFLKSVMGDDNLSTSDKKGMLGSFVFDELMTHSDIMSMNEPISFPVLKFATGGEVDPLIEKGIKRLREDDLGRLASLANSYEQNGNIQAADAIRSVINRSVSPTSGAFQPIKDLGNFIAGLGKGAKDVLSDVFSGANAGGVISGGLGALSPAFNAAVGAIRGVNSLAQNINTQRDDIPLITGASYNGSVYSAGNPEPLVSASNPTPVSTQPPATNTRGSGYPLEMDRVLNRYSGPSRTPASTQPPVSSSARTEPTAKTGNDNVRALQEYYNKFASSRGYESIPVDGILGDKTARAIYNLKQFGIDVSANAVSRLNVNDGSTITDIGSVSITGQNGVTFDAAKYSPTKFSIEDLTYSDFVSDTPVEVDPSDPSYVIPDSLLVNNDLSSLQRSIAAGTYVPDLVIPSEIVQDVSPEQVSASNGISSSFIDEFGDFAGILSGIAMASGELSPYERTDDYMMAGDILRNRAGQGFSRSSVSDYLSSVQNRRQTLASALSSSGGTQGQIAAALSNVAAGGNDELVNFLIADENLRNSNANTFVNFAVNDQLRDDRLTQEQRNIELNRQAAGAGLIGAIMENKSEMDANNELFGPDSNFQKIIELENEAKKRSSLQVDALLDGFKNMINPKPNTEAKTNAN